MVVERSKDYREADRRMNDLAWVFLLRDFVAAKDMTPDLG